MKSHIGFYDYPEPDSEPPKRLIPKGAKLGWDRVEYFIAGLFCGIVLADLLALFAQVLK